MKKLFALLAVVLAVVSCQKDVDNLDVNVGGEQLVNITVGLPEATRVASDTGFDFANLGNNFELRYILEIYAEGNTTDCIRKEVFTKNQSVVFPVRLIHGRDYHVVAWADIVPANANRTAEGDYDYYYETSNGLTAVEIISWNAMDEYRDAFTTFADIENFSANRSLDLTLVRPFAKIRVVSTDIKDIEDLGFELGRGEVTYRYDMYRKFNAYTGTASDAASKAHTFTYPTVYAQSGDADETETQRTLYADYIFVDDVKNPDVVQFTMNVWDSNDVLIKETQFMTDIPVHANKLTTIIGEVLTEGGNVKVTIDNTLEEQERVTVVSSASHLLKVINAGGEYIMGNNIIVTAKDVAEAQGIITRSTGEAKTTTINLNGYTITLQANVEVKEGNTLIIDNEPLNENGGDKGAVINDNGAIVNNGTLVIEGGNYNAGAIQNNGTTNVNGGDFADDAINNNGNVTIEGDNSGRSDDIVNNDEEATLNKVVYNAEELQAALDAKNADEIIFGADIKGEATISQTEGVNVVIDGKGHKFDGTLNIYGNARNTGTETLTIKNINFEADAAKYFIDSNWTDTARRYAHNVTIQDCTFTSLADNNSVAVCGIRFRQAHNININGCTADNTFFLAWFTGCNNTTIENCRAINNYEGITLGNGTTTTIKGSSIDADLYGIRVESNLSNYSDTHNVTIENCEFDAFIPVSARSLTTGKFNLALQGVNNFTRGGDYDIALCANEYKAGVIPTLPTAQWTISGAENYVVFPYQWAVANANELQNAINKANADVKINFTADIEGEIMIQQKANVNLTIDGQGKKFDGTFTIDGMNRGNEPEFVKFYDIEFFTESTESMNFIYAPYALDSRVNLYAHNIIVDNCKFTYNGAADVMGMTTEQAYGITVTNTVCNGLHSLGQIKSNSKFAKFENVTINSARGLNFNNAAPNVTFDNCNITATKVDGYCIRTDHTAGSSLTVKNSTLTGYEPIVLRKCAAEASLKVENTTINKTNGGIYDINVASGSMPNNEGIEDYIVYPRDVVSSWDEFTAALANGKTFFLLAEDITYNANYQLQKDVVIDLNGKSMTLPMINIHNKVTIKNGTINGSVYARKNCDITFDNVKFSGAISASHLQIQAGGTNIYAKDCLFSPTSVSGSARPVEGEYGTSGNIKFENCEFKNSPYKGQIYFNSLSATATLDFTNCNFNNKTPNIMFAATCPLTNLTMSGTTKLGSVTLETNRAKDAVTDADLAYLRESLIANNSMSSVRLFYAGGSSEYIR